VSALRGQWTSQVDRRLFIPDLIWDLDDGWQVPVRRQDDPDRWEALVSADEAVITQLDDGAAYRGADPSRRASWLTSSSSAPWLMNRMLGALQIEPGLRVLEIGTGTGWNAAVMAAAGMEVTSVEIDERLAYEARSALARAGFGRVVVVCGDGELGAPGRAPFDRVIATAAAHTVPYPWVGQTADGGLIVFPYTGVHHPCGLAVLTVSAGVACGRIVGEAGFMPLRGQRLHPMELEKLGEVRSDVSAVVIEVGPHGQRVTAEAC
jgi:protein-L-isoaspartate(D-aspartate) O-methyltransferase